MSIAQFDVRPWNLGVPLALLAACGRTLIIPEDNGDSGVDPSDPTETTASTLQPEVGGECRVDDDCPSGWQCSYGVCQYDYYCSDGDCCDDKCCYDGCWYYECYDDYSCGEGYECVGYYCQPRPNVEPQQCYDFAIGFSAPLPIATIAGQVSLAFVDAPGGGDELVIGDGQGVTTFGNNGTSIVDTIPVAALDVGDLEGDGDSDIVIAETETIAGSVVRAYLRDGQAFYEASSVEVPGYIAKHLEITDLDGTGIPGVFMGTDDGTVWIQGIGKGQLGAAEYVFDGEACGLEAIVSTPQGPAERLAFSASGLPQLAYSLSEVEPLPTNVMHSTACEAGSGDVDADGWQDYVMLERTSPPVLSTWGAVEQSNYAVTWPMPVSASAIAVADLDGDGRDDVVTTDPVGPTMVRLGGPWRTPDGSYDPLGCYVLFDLGFAPFELAIGDLDGDGRLDIVGAADGEVWLAPGA